MAKNPTPDNQRKAALADDSRRAYTSRGLAELVPLLTRPAYRRRSPAGALLMSEWSQIVGPRLALQTEPRRLTGLQLTIACAGPVAMELQHLSGVLIERINTHAGRTLVDRLRFVQDILTVRAPKATRAAVPPRPVEGVEEGELNEALGRLRAAIEGRKQSFFEKKDQKTFEIG